VSRLKAGWAHQVGVALALSGLTGVAAAQQRPAADLTLLGAAAWARPAYQGADERRVDLIPVIRYYGAHWFARTTQGQLEGGWRTALAPGLHAGAQLAYEMGRRTRESAFLGERNMPTLDDGASLGLHLELDRDVGPVPVNVLLRHRQHLDFDLGASVDLRTTVGVAKTDRLLAGVFGQVTWSSDRAMQSYFGITEQQSAVTGFGVYDAGAGTRFLSFGVLGGYDLSRHWVTVGSAEVHFLRGDAKGSPLVHDPSNLYGFLGLAYRF
jgi:outer membrane scaffolding protein for murein synthesis (MipA/OmpV family)